MHNANCANGNKVDHEHDDNFHGNKNKKKTQRRSTEFDSLLHLSQLDQSVCVACWIQMVFPVLAILQISRIFAYYTCNMTVSLSKWIIFFSSARCYLHVDSRSRISSRFAMRLAIMMFSFHWKELHNIVHRQIACVEVICCTEKAKLCDIAWWTFLEENWERDFPKKILMICFYFCFRSN